MLPIFAEWRVQLETELEEAREELDQARQAQAEAEAAARAANIERGELARAFGRLGSREPLATALDNRRHEYEDALRNAEGPRSRARGMVQSAVRKVDDLEQALRQLDVIAPLEPAAEVAEPALEDA